MVYVVGVVGYIPAEKADEIQIWEDVKDLLKAATFNIRDDILVMTKLVENSPINKSAYYYAKQQGWNTGGIACEKTLNQKWLPMSDDGDVLKIVGETWGDESEEFVNRLDVFIRLGSDKQSNKEMKLAKLRKIRVLEKSGD